MTDGGPVMGAEHHGPTVPSGLDAPDRTASGRGRFGRMFPFVPVRDPGEAAITALAAAMDNAIVGSENDEITAGYTYLGQFIDHDVTFDPTSQLAKSNDPFALVDFRTPRLDLDSLYGSGPADQPYLYERTEARNRGVKLLVGRNPTGGNDDLPRNDDGVALTGDPRNDENLIIAQLHLLFIRFHNNVVDHVRSQRPELPAGELFREAQRLVRWHYQWIVVHEYLPKIVGSRTLTRQRVEPTFYKWEHEPFVPVEFSGAAFRFGHSMVRESYKLNQRTERKGVPIFPDPKHPGLGDHLRGFRRLPADLVIDWGFFFEIPNHAPAQLSHTIDTNIAQRLSNLPHSVSRVHRLPLLNLRRGRALGLPAGSDVALVMDEDPLTVKRTKLLDSTLPANASRTTREALLRAPPLWYFVLAEAETTREGKQLGAVGGRIVAEVLLGLLRGDPHSYVRASPGWTPDAEELTLTKKLSRPRDGGFKMVDLIEFAQQQQQPAPPPPAPQRRVRTAVPARVSRVVP
jgi:hypothetical protein